ncbi:MAG: NCS2 family permease [Pseudomonadota bacterium]
MLEKFFKLSEHSTNIRTEILAGFTTFLTMAYIIFVQVQVLTQAGMDPGSVMVATCIASAIATILMGLLANYPIGLAPGMGENFFFLYSIVLGFGIGWDKALGMVFISGTVFILLSLLKIREMVINAIPHCLKVAIAVGIGIFISFIGLIEAGIVVKSAGGIVAKGNFSEPPVMLAIAGLLIIGILAVRKVRGFIIIGIIATAIIGIATGILKYQGIFSLPPSIKPTLFKLDILGVLKFEYIVPILTLLYMDMFDTIGTLIGVTSQAGLIKNDKLPRASQALFSDAVGTVAGALLGTSTVTSYIESITGIKSGGRTGLTAITIGILFLLALFFFPIVEMIARPIQLSNGSMIHPVTAPALIMVGAMMMAGIRDIAWDNLVEAIPAFLTIIAIPFTFSIADGIAIGFISYPILMLCAGKGKKVSWLVYVLGILFVARYVFL